MSRFHVIRTAVVGLLIPFSFSFPTSASEDGPTLLPRADADCFATSFGISDFKAFGGSATQPASVSFKTVNNGIEGQLVCSRGAENGSTSPFFTEPVACNKTDLPNVFFAYPEDRLLQVYEVTNCGTEE
jgi:hypothetical protein